MADIDVGDTIVLISTIDIGRSLFIWSALFELKKITLNTSHDTFNKKINP